MTRGVNTGKTLLASSCPGLCCRFSPPGGTVVPLQEQCVCVWELQPTEHITNGKQPLEEESIFVQRSSWALLYCYLDRPKLKRKPPPLFPQAVSTVHHCKWLQMALHWQNTSVKTHCPACIAIPTVLVTMQQLTVGHLSGRLVTAVWRCCGCVLCWASAAGLLLNTIREVYLWLDGRLTSFFTPWWHLHPQSVHSCLEGLIYGHRLTSLCAPNILAYSCLFSTDKVCRAVTHLHK